MQWSETVKEYVDTLTPIKLNTELNQRVMSLLDLTSLNSTDTEESIAVFCQKARNDYGHVAAVCVYPQFARLIAAEFMGTPIKTATVANFPSGEENLEKVLIEISQALQAGAQEIDVVFPYLRYLAGERQYAQSFVSACKAACGENVTLKVILETGALSDPAIIADASYDVLVAGADFIKTSTGKISEGATLEAAGIMLLVVKHVSTQLKRRLGVKIAGGIKTLEEAGQYIELADQILGKSWVGPETFRIGSSKLVDAM